MNDNPPTRIRSVGQTPSRHNSGSVVLLSLTYGLQYLYCISTVETLSLWRIAKGERIHDFTDIRARLSKSCNLEVHYLVDCHYDHQSQRLFLAAGCNEYVASPAV